MVTVYTSRLACEITGVSHRQLNYWRKSGLLGPSQFTEGGHARYSFTDLVALKTAKQLLDAGVSLQKIRKSISSLIAYLPTLERPLTELSLIATGDIILVLHEGSAFEALSGQEWIFPIARMQRDIERLHRKDNQLQVQTELFPDTDAGNSSLKSAHGGR